MVATLRHFLLRYGLAFLAVVTVTLLSLSLRELAEGSIFLLAFAAVLMSAWYGGLGPGLFVTLLAAAGMGIVVFPPQSSPVISNSAQAIQLVLFVLVGLLVSWLAAARRRAELALQVTNQQLTSILETITDGFITVDHEWRLTYVNPRAAEMVQRPPEALVGRVVWEIFSQTQALPSYIESRRAAAGQTPVRLEDFDSERNRWFESDIYPGEEGLAIFLRDVTWRKQAEAERERLLEQLETEHARLEAVLRQMPAGVIIADAPSGRLVLVNEQVAQILRHPFLPTGEVMQYDKYRGFHGDGRPYEPEEWPLIRSVRDGEVVEGEEINILRGDGTCGTIRVSSAPIRNRNGQVVAAVMVFYDITEQKQAADRLGFLAEAGAMLSSSLDYEATLSAVARLAVPKLADWCAVDILAEDGTSRRLAVAHTNPERAELVQEIMRRYPPAMDAPGGLGKVLRTGASEFYPEISDEFLVAAARDEEHLRLIRQVGVTSVIIVALAARGRTLGAITLASAQPGRRYHQEDLMLAEELARRASIAVDNARLYEAEQETRRLAEKAAARNAQLYEITAALSEALTPEEVARGIVELGIGGLGARAGSIMTLNSETNELEMVGSLGYPPWILERYSRIPLSLDFPMADVVREGEPIILFNAEERDARFPHLAELRRANGDGAMAAIPFVIDGRVAGALGFNFPESRPLSPEDRPFLIALAQQCGQALERARLYDAERKARTEAETARQRSAFVAEAGQKLAAALDYAETLQTVARLAVPALADCCVVEAIEDHQLRAPQVVAVCADPAVRPLVDEIHRAGPGDPARLSTPAQALQTGQPFLFAEIGDAASELFPHLERLRAAGFTTAMVVPLVARGRTLGLMTFARGESARRYESDDLTLAGELAQRAALAVDNARLYREAQEAVRQRDAFLSIASHELKTPLTVLRGYAELVHRRALRGEYSSERDKRALQIIYGQSRRLEKLIDDLLDLTRIQTGRLTPEPRPMDFGALARRVVDEFRPALERHTLELTVSDEPLIVNGDEFRLEQVIQNLIQNAVKYSPKGGPITVSLGRHDDHVLLSVSDRGLGIPEASLPHLFDRFYRASNVTGQAISGMGIGLYVVKEIVLLHRGSVAVESNEGQGSTFIVRLPLCDRERSKTLERTGGN